MTLVTMFICSLWAPSKSHQLNTLTKTSCYWCQTCQDDDAAEEGAATCSEWYTISRICSHCDWTLKSKKRQDDKKNQTKKQKETPNQFYGFTPPKPALNL